MRYLRFSSLSWWAGVVSIALGVLGIVAPSEEASQLGRVLAALLGGADASPAGLVVLGLGIIGLRDKLERG
ncbi:hypothetical protein SAMN05444722_1672 [Rhodovulum sp. ES.010]|uniref:hypothetical protein n=1 Tax=Rhodovulum sp. ES.010 TaxID=1882821 RepID=UPI00092C3447|nr:hypothetical protein [Rhodovulum sp. ES.010]SIO36193.1 hypothetical protein SAMN05444722_1672 [Rhodovulum sp. ES.010]